MSTSVHAQENAKPWVFWYWMYAAVSQPGIHADLVAMKEAGLGGAYLMPINGKSTYTPVAEQLSPAWWDLVHYASQQADSLGLQLGMHFCDGFAVGGGPWITPALSMQKVVWTTTEVNGDFNGILSQPATNEGYYEDIAVLAFPFIKEDKSTPVVTTSLPNVNAQILSSKENKENVKSTDPCWIQYTYAAPFTCRSITIRGNNYQAQRLKLSVSEDGTQFHEVLQMTAPRHGWLDSHADHTYSIPVTTSRYFRFDYNKAGSEPGAEDLDNAKWKQSLKITGIHLSNQPRIDQYEGKSGAVWRISNTVASTVPAHTSTSNSITSKIPANINTGNSNTNTSNSITSKVPANINIGNSITSKIPTHTNTSNSITSKVPTHTNTSNSITSKVPAHTNTSNSITSKVPANTNTSNSITSTVPAHTNTSNSITNAVPTNVNTDHAITNSDLAIAQDQIIDLTTRIDTHGHLKWKAPKGDWTILRIGHTSTGHKNVTGGAGAGLECDKFNPAAVRFQFDHWYGEALKRAKLSVLHVDSWECGSQNWSPVFSAAFKKQHGYDLLKWLPAMAGIPVDNAAASEQFLLDIRRTINNLIQVNFYDTLSALAHTNGVAFSAESTAPMITGDGMEHYHAVDYPMGEFWLRSPTHDKPNDMLDAISGAHVYDKQIIQAEAFTELRNSWDEYPGMLKTGIDRNFALGINKLVFHVFAHNPWMDKKPGMTLNGIGLYFQRDQTWWPYVSAMVNYVTRCQHLLQQGKPVVDIGVYTGDNLPKRAVLPERLVPLLPTLFGDSTVQREKRRLANVGEPTREMPAGVTASANISKAEDWIDPLHGYAYDSYNKLSDSARYRISLKLTDTLKHIDIPPDFISGEQGIAWTHRSAPDKEIYFVSNQQEKERHLQLSFRVKGKTPVLYDAVNDAYLQPEAFKTNADRTSLTLSLPPNGAMFVLFTDKPMDNVHKQTYYAPFQTLDNPWKVSFAPNDTVLFEKLTDWSQHASEKIKYFSGTAHYIQNVHLPNPPSTILLDAGNIANIAAVKVNDIDCGIIWTPPYRVDISKAVHSGLNKIDIAVTNTWANRIIGDRIQTAASNRSGDSSQLKETYTVFSDKQAGDHLLPAGLLGPVRLLTDYQVADTVMERVYNEVKTPYKYGLVMVPANDTLKMDCPTIFRKNNQWYMVYIVFDGRGYETWLAKSKDLLNWQTLGKMMSFSDSTNWDANQKAGYTALQDYKWGGNYEWTPYKGKYWLSYFGGASTGYEAGLLSIGIAYTNKDITRPHEWQRMPHPVLKATDTDAGWWENNTIYKSSVIRDDKKLTGHSFVMYYNAKGDSMKPKRGKERIGMAVSDDMEHWVRWGKDPLLDHYTGITGDAVIQQMDSLYVMFYYGAFWKDKPKEAFNRFACSYDLVHWTDWKGADLINSSEAYDNLFAHKSFVVKWKGVVYHYYCAVDKAGHRGIAVATSVDKGKSKLNY
ncbi:DNA-binding protein [[Flexibacter] sp. ATCC 35208]|nr:DNA-binding protein [[Flexibacter] sp. ATCC 35208]